MIDEETTEPLEPNRIHLLAETLKTICKCKQWADDRLTLISRREPEPILVGDKNSAMARSLNLEVDADAILSTMMETIQNQNKGFFSLWLAAAASPLDIKKHALGEGLKSVNITRQAY